MTNNERRIYEMFGRVCVFLEMHSGSFPDSSRGDELFDALKMVVEELDGHAEAQVSKRSASVQGTASKKAARDALRRSLEAINRTARAMALNTPGLDERFHLPRGNNEQSLLATARAFLTDAEPLKAEFIRNEHQPNFLEILRTLIANFEQSITEQNRSIAARVTATNAIKSAIERGLTIVRQLDAIVRNKFADDNATLAAWERASHTERAPRSAKSKSPANSASPAQ
jgi:hypothetical protein